MSVCHTHCQINEDTLAINNFMQVSRITFVRDYYHSHYHKLNPARLFVKFDIYPFVQNRFACVHPAGRRCRCSINQKPKLVSPSFFDILSSIAWVFGCTETPPVILYPFSGLQEMKKLKQRTSWSPRVRFSTIFCNIYWS